MTQRAEYEFKYYTPAGEYLFSILNYHSANLWVSEREVGSFYIDIPYEIANKIIKVIELDGIFEIYRSYSKRTPQLLFKKRWFVALWRDKIDEKGVRYTRIRCHCCNNLVDRRIIYYRPETAEVIIDSVPADNAIKRLVRQNLGDLCTVASRDWSDRIVVSPYTSLAPTISMDGLQYRKLLPVLKEACDITLEEHDVYLTYDLFWNNTTQKYIFNTYVNQLGVNRGSDSETPLFLTAYTDDKYSEFGGLGYASMELDGTDRRTAVYCGGQGEKEDRVIKEAFNADEINRVPFGLWEDWEDARRVGTEEGVQAAADIRLQRWTPRVAVNGHISPEFSRYIGVELNWGDRVVFKFKDNIYDVNLYKVQISLENDGSEKIQIFTRNMKESYY